MPVISVLLFIPLYIYHCFFITELTTWILIIMPMRVHMGVMTPGCTAVTPMDRVTPLTSPTVVSIIRTSGPLMVHESLSTVAVVIETFPEW